MTNPSLPEKTVDALIVGQGLAGTLLAFNLLNRGCSVHVIDRRLPGTASQVAAGLINPITGRRYLKSWRFDELLPVARDRYRQLEGLLGIRIFHPLPLIRSIFSIREENDWLSRTGDPAYSAYVREEADLGAYAGNLHPARSYGQICQAAQVDLPLLNNTYRAHLQAAGRFTEATFQYENLETGEELLRYGSLTARYLIFCEGWRGAENPWFGHLPFKGDKGDVLLVRFPGRRFEAALKHKVFIIPLPGGKYWIGATYVHNFDEPDPLPSGREALEKRLQQTVTVPYEVDMHLAAVRPTVSDRRPMLGRHPADERLLLFNGLGTKGASLGPYWADHLARHLTEDTPIDPEADIRRFAAKR